VDLDGAFQGKPVNIEIVSKIAKAVSIPVEIGGGIRNIETVELYVKAGIERIIMGSAVLEAGFDEIIKKYKDKIIAGIDAKDSMVAVKGWKDVTTIKADELIAEVISKGVKEIIYTDISTDGMLQGPNISAFEHILAKFPQLTLIASGGVSSIEDIVKLNNLKSGKLKGVITGKAIYDGRLNLSDAVNAVA
jgi:phosphoribosylformimino-5-aminoimidazole carboxamide ribotide isomerase